MAKKSRTSKRRKKKSAAPASPLTAFLPAGALGAWLLRATLVYLLFNVVLNLGLALTRPYDLSGIFELGHVDTRSQAAWMLSRHTLFHTSWADEQEIPALIEHYAQRHGLEPTLFRALVEQESRLRPHAVSGVGACGLAQLMPETARSLGVKDPFNPHENLNAGARYLASLRRQFRGDVALALAAYNAGPGNVRKYGGIPPFRETQGYVHKILTRHRVLRGPRKPTAPSMGVQAEKKETAASTGITKKGTTDTQAGAEQKAGKKAGANTPAAPEAGKKAGEITPAPPEAGKKAPEKKAPEKKAAGSTSASTQTQEETPLTAKRSAEPAL
ncbi:MAG: transglycosylase SLT domain-containing protein [Myxococcota bacterium]